MAIPRACHRDWGRSQQQADRAPAADNGTQAGRSWLRNGWRVPDCALTCPGGLRTRTPRGTGHQVPSCGALGGTRGSASRLPQHTGGQTSPEGAEAAFHRRPRSPAPVPNGRAAPRQTHLKNFRMRFIAMVTASASTSSWRRCVRATATQRPKASFAGRVNIRPLARDPTTTLERTCSDCSRPAAPPRPWAIAASDCLSAAFA